MKAKLFNSHNCSRPSCLSWLVEGLVPVWFGLMCCGFGIANSALAKLTSERVSKLHSDVEFTLPLAEKNAREVDQAIEQLGSPEFAKREQGSQMLSSIGASAFRKLQEAYQAADDLEVRLRIERIVRQAYINFHIFSRNGFLGIERPRRSFLTHIDDKRIEMGSYGIRVTKIAPHTGAAHAGMAADDVVIAIDGTSFPINENPSATFGEIIRRNPPGTIITLSILRGKHAIEVEAKLGTCPPGDVRPGRMDAVANDLADAQTRFGGWWARNFAD